MSFVPIFVHTPPPPSPRTKELARRVQELIEQFRMEHSGVSNAEINHALQLARASTPQQAMIMVALVTALLLAVVLLLIFLK